MFIFVLCEGIFVRYTVLPYIFPGLHVGNGFMVGGDSIGYHNLAIEIADRINTFGWKEWTLRPTTDVATLATPAGIAAAIYAFIYPDPLLLLPFNAFIHAASAVVLFFVFNSLLEDKKASIIAIVPFIIFPTSLAWTSQLLKEGPFIFGSYIYLYSWMYIADSKTFSARSLLILLLAFFGLFIIWSVRAYTMIVFLWVTLLLGGLIFGCSLFKNDGWRKNAQVLFFIIAITLAIQYVRAIDHSPKISEWRGNEVLQPLRKVSISGNKVENPSGLVVENELNLSAEDYSPASAVDELKWEIKKCPDWVNSKYLPDRINQLILKILIVRSGYYDNVYLNAASTVDREKCITSPREFFEYFPRAMQLGLFSPFPNDWALKTQEKNAYRSVAAVEMLFSYCSFFGLLLFMWRYFRKLKFFIMSTYCISMILIYSIVTPNIGALYRMRFGFFIIFVGMGFAFIYKNFHPRKQS